MSLAATSSQTARTAAALRMHQLGDSSWLVKGRDGTTPSDGPSFGWVQSHPTAGDTIITCNGRDGVMPMSSLTDVDQHTMFDNQGLHINSDHVMNVSS